MIVKETRTVAIPMMEGRELLFQFPAILIASDVHYLEILQKYIALLYERTLDLHVQPDEEDAQLLAEAVADEPGLNRILEEEGE